MSENICVWPDGTTCDYDTELDEYLSFMSDDFITLPWKPEYEFMDMEEVYNNAAIAQR